MEKKSKFIEHNLKTELSCILPEIQSRIMSQTFYFGIKTLKNPLDFWIYQEIIFKRKPDIIIEIGNAFGGSTLALAHICDNLKNGKVIGVDINHSKISDYVLKHNRITLFEGKACSMYDNVKKLIKPEDRVLIIEDSSHKYHNTLDVLRTYSPLIKEGDYFIVEDSICHHGLNVGPNPGPYEAIETFISENGDFEIDRDMESFIITWNPKGFLRKKKTHITSLQNMNICCQNDIVNLYSRSQDFIDIDNIQNKKLIFPENYIAHASESSEIEQLKTEISQGSVSYLKVLKSLHHQIKPDFYLEIGVANGGSLALTECDALGIDPKPSKQIIPLLISKPYIKIAKQSSDDFFKYRADKLIKKPIDLAFIDGMHLFEYALRDFINIENFSNEKTVVVFDDVLPNNHVQASRKRLTGMWTGDVWKIYYCLAKYRPDLSLSYINCSPGGLLVVRGLKQDSRKLQDEYNTIVDEFLSKRWEIVPSDILNKKIINK